MLSQVVQQCVNGLVLGSIYTLIALGLTMLYGILGVVNWAHGEIYMLGAFLGFYMVSGLGMPYLVALLLSMAVMGGAGLIVERVVFRPLRRTPQMNMMLGTLGLSILLLNAAILIWGPNPMRFPAVYSERYLVVGNLSITWQRFLVVAFTTTMIVFLSVFIRKTRTGKAMRACAQNPQAAALMGIDIDRIAMVTTAISCMLAAAAGTLIAPIFLVYPAMSILAVSKAFAVVVLGGLGNVEGAIFGGFVLGIAESFTGGFFSSYYKDLVTFVIMIVVLILRPGGIFGRSLMEKV